LDNPDAAGRLQTEEDDRVAVIDVADQAVVYSPPPASQLPARMRQLVRFSNGEVKQEGFLHPVVRSILVHFWMGYDHPFEDGNGRTARTLFYWSMKHQGYWLTDFLSISRILAMAPAQYARAYLYTETDSGDTTYFIIYHLNVIVRAIKELNEYLQRKIRQVRQTEERLRASSQYNYREMQLLGDALRHPDRRYTFKTHSRSHGVSLQSARNDLLDLEQRGLLEGRKVGRQFVFSPVDDLAERVTSKGS
jgi:Fic family protein